MRHSEATMVRIHLHEFEAHLKELPGYLQDKSKVPGVTVLAGN